MMDHRNAMAGSRQLVAVCLAVLFVTSLCVGCRPASTTPAPKDGETKDKKTDGSDVKTDKDATKTGQQQTTQGQVTADAVLQRMIETYQAAKTYEDQAVVRMVVKHPQGDQRQQYQAAISLERPNRARIVRDGVLVVSDGEKIYGKPDGWNEQVVVTEAPKEITVPGVYNIEPLLPLLSPGVEGHSAQLDLLAAAQPLKDLREADAAPKLLDAETLRDRPCHRLQFETEAGELVLWIDQESSILHRVQYPTNELLKSLADQGVEEVVMTADFEEAKLNEPIDEKAFAWPKSDDETLVRYLVTPPDARLAPHPIVGEPVPEFTMTTDSGDDEKSTDLKGKVSVIDLWATWCPYCIQGMPKFGAAYKAGADNEQVRYVALSVDDAGVSDKALAAALEQTGAKVPWARVTGDDPYGTIRKGFQLPGIPAYVILDKEGRVQFLHIGGDLDLAKDLPERVTQILDGKDLAAETKKLWEPSQEQYRQEMQLAPRVDAASAMIEIARSDVAERSEPESLKITELWKNTELKAPGNILVVGSGEESPAIFVIDDFQNIVELDTEGKVVAKHGEGLPEKSAITYLNTATDKDDQRIYVAASVGGPQFFVFDDQWKLKLKYPEENTASVYDVLPADLDGNGELELCVGYYREAGVHAVTMDGKRLWRNRWMSNVGDLAATRPDDDGQRRLLCVHSFGTLGVVDSQGESLPSIELPNRAITHILTADLGDEAPAELAAITVDLSGQRSLVGLSADGEILWQHLLPPGEHETLIKMLTAAKLFPEQPGHWLVATADGTVHVVSADGSQYDKFGTGEKLTGLAGLQTDGKGVLLIASDKGLTAMSVERSE